MTGKREIAFCNKINYLQKSCGISKSVVSFCYTVPFVRTEPVKRKQDGFFVAQSFMVYLLSNRSLMSAGALADSRNRANLKTDLARMNPMTAERRSRPTSRKRVVEGGILLTDTQARHIDNSGPHKGHHIQPARSQGTATRHPGRCIRKEHSMTLLSYRCSM